MVGIRRLSELEYEIVSVERIDQYLQIQPEVKYEKFLGILMYFIFFISTVFHVQTFFRSIITRI